MLKSAVCSKKQKIGLGYGCDGQERICAYKAEKKAHQSDMSFQLNFNVMMNILMNICKKQWKMRRMFLRTCRTK